MAQDRGIAMELQKMPYQAGMGDVPDNVGDAAAVNTGPSKYNEVEPKKNKCDGLKQEDFDCIGEI